MEFFKMHGLGNDFIVLDQLKHPTIEDPAGLAKRLCPRGFGVGADGLVLILPSDVADARMRIFNPDGSEPEMCGNAVRCVAKYLYESGAVATDALAVETLAGIMRIRMEVRGAKMLAASVDMGAPEARGHAALKVGDQRADFAVISTGNPHAVTYSVFPDDALFAEAGPRIEKNPFFPDGTNVEFCRVLAPDHIEVRVWERGAGPTLACGTGATASFFAGVQARLLEKEATVTLPGGDLRMNLREDGHVVMTGPAELAYRGSFNL